MGVRENVSGARAQRIGKDDDDGRNDMCHRIRGLTNRFNWTQWRKRANPTAPYI